MKNKTYIVIDESGAIHQKNNNFFVIAGYITQRIYSVKSCHKKLEKHIKDKYPKTNKYEELKACYLKPTQKAEFLNELFKIPTTIPIGIIVDKKHLIKRNKHDENIKYNYFLGLLLNFLLENHQELFPHDDITLILDNRNVKVGSLNSLEDYLNTTLGLTKEKNFKVFYYDSKGHRTVQMADLIANTFFGYYNYKNKGSTYYKVPALKNAIISKFPYKYFGKTNDKKALTQ